MEVLLSMGPTPSSLTTRSWLRTSINMQFLTILHIFGRLDQQLLECYRVILIRSLDGSKKMSWKYLRVYLAVLLKNTYLFD